MTPPLPRYEEHAPAPRLRPFVECYWSTCGAHPAGTLHRHRVLPDGCMDVIVDLSSARAHVIGTMTRPLDVRQSGTVDFLAVRFRPGAAPALLGVPAHACVDDRVELAAVWGPAAQALLDRLGEAPSPARRLEVLDRTWTARLEASPPDRLVLAAAGRLADVRPPAVDELSDVLGVGRRTLERRFRTAVGLSPWHLARVERFRRAVHLLLTGSGDLARAAYGAGYHDQPHMTRDFRELAGDPPGAWLEARRSSGPTAAGDAIVQDAGDPTPLA